MAVDMSGVMQHLLDKVKKRGFSDDDIVRVAASQGDQLLDKFADVIAQSARKPQESYPVVVNYDLSVEEAVEAGNYQAVNADITHEHFSWKQKGQIAAEIVLVRFEHRMTSQGVIDELENEGLRPAELPEILAFGAQYPEVQRKFSVVGLGSIWQDRKGSRNVPCLYEASEGRYLDLHWWDDGWYAYSRFAALRK